MMPSGELADVRELASLAQAAEEHGWDGFFVWDHLLRPPNEPAEIADTTVALAAVALATATIRFGPMVTPIARRRPQKLAKEAMTLDQLSAGRLILGLGLGVDAFGELFSFGELTDPVQRGDQLDEGADLLARLVSGEVVDHHDVYFRASHVQLLPPPAQQPRIPIWMAATGERPRPVRRSAHYDGLYVLDVDPGAVRRIAGMIAAIRGSLDDFDLAVSASSDADLPALAEAGATWAMWECEPGEPVTAIRSRLAALGPAG
jgi:alkanesulfonate monooxygenase SsuD/methylene tetrahydromethanopterin reductase-like flavin-dependent oxidoreductase (luciferase family)